ncbi:malonate decarboxylase holo-[acyl-carrier-protein] synthase [Legionella sp. PATHC038]|uniref:phosphoribosyl-dephospho-CoA transferase MdcG domain-containing protein n=1 Tax=Legionella sheltonii TaxID=2992041 RepID=UPI0022444082|nr:phosphoribosyl-dephospho-CoA transferase MdcG domain-containing protein [Legionella sp. PATHC038]MCW8400068.1 malonate decarboxylase holo-[acyl-carrier-protein] synthase [Legionella sp. PATHC038]
MNAQRHHLIYLKPHADFVIRSCHEDQKMIAEKTALWLAQGLPCIYAKQFAGQETINLGLTLLHDNQKHRIGLQVAPSFVQTQKPLPQLIEMHEFFSRYYQITDLQRITNLYPVSDIAVYGSFLFHYLSGYSFVNQTSDLDLLIYYQGYSWSDLHETIQALTKKFKRTIDGEVRFPLFGDIPIKELLDLSAKKLLCKSKDQVALLSRTELYEYYTML